LFLAVSLTASACLLGYFKYHNFLVENLTGLASCSGLSVRFTMSNVLPVVGMSFYTFQTMGYTIDVYRGRCRARTNLIDYLAYVSFFPQLVAGPIERATRLLPQFEKERRFDPGLAEDGLRQMMCGFFKKMAIADNLAPIVNAVYANPDAMTGPQLAFATVCFAIQIYCDFSGYSDIAIGSARLFGFDLMRNFAYPYFSQSPAEFWKRWHISLSTWFRDYLYIPLGGSRNSVPRTIFNVLVTFMVSGLWHGASWNYVIWGALNGLALIPSILLSRTPSQARNPGDTPGGERLIPTFGTAARMLGTFGFVCMTWVFFRAATFADAKIVLTRITRDAFTKHAYRPAFDMLVAHQVTILLVIGFLAAEWIQRRHEHVLKIHAWPQPLRWAAYTGCFWLTLFNSSITSVPFIYFQF
jgi:D-alanyl-lipoteichoic acid acyltransferase DltB (MBOAT superfamily)